MTIPQKLVALVIFYALMSVSTTLMAREIAPVFMLIAAVIFILVVLLLIVIPTRER